MPARPMRYLQDLRLWLAVLAAPLAWLLLWLLGLPVDREFPAIASLLRAALVYPVLEELVFRGGIQMLLRENLPMMRTGAFGVSMANAVTSILFSAMHLFTHAPLWALLVILPSLVFGWAMEHFGRVTVPIFLHVFYNAGFLLLFVN